eukprot:216428-Chlamydomonas_euryale.AAC.1
MHAGGSQACMRLHGVQRHALGCMRFRGMHGAAWGSGACMQEVQRHAWGCIGFRGMNAWGFTGMHGAAC